MDVTCEGRDGRPDLMMLAAHQNGEPGVRFEPASARGGQRSSSLPSRRHSLTAPRPRTYSTFIPSSCVLFFLINRPKRFLFDTYAVLFSYSFHLYYLCMQLFLNFRFCAKALRFFIPLENLRKPFALTL
jgi:hypothetical protein